MIFYFIPLVFLSLLSTFENLNKFRDIIKSSFFYYLFAIFLVLFIGFRFEIGCDWDQYVQMFERYSTLTFKEMFVQNFLNNENYTLQEFGHIFLTTISGNIYLLNLIYSLIFVFPLLYFASFTKNKYLTLLISYPYYTIVVGMGPIRQAACISILMISIILVARKKFHMHFFLSIISLLIHQFSIIFNFLIILPSLPNLSNSKLTKRGILMAVILICLFIYGAPALWNKLYFYIKLYGFYNYSQNAYVLNPAKGAFFVWFLIFIPNLIFIKNKLKFNLSKEIKKILIIFSIIEFLILPFVFVNSVIAYRLLLYLFPTSILITAQIPSSNIIKFREDIVFITIIFSSFFTLFIWLKFAYHSYCWVPYKNILLMQ